MNILAITLIFTFGFIIGMAVMGLVVIKGLEEYKEERLGKNGRN